jgi:hypothetical protein
MILDWRERLVLLALWRLRIDIGRNRHAAGRD